MTVTDLKNKGAVALDDAQLKALQVQLTGLGAAPVVPVSSHSGGGAET